MLGPKQAEELHKAIIAYLATHNLPDSAAALRAEANLTEETFDAATAKKYETLLEKKWNIVGRLQRRVRKQLEAKGSADDCSGHGSREQEQNTTDGNGQPHTICAVPAK